MAEMKLILLLTISGAALPEPAANPGAGPRPGAPAAMGAAAAGDDEPGAPGGAGISARAARAGVALHRVRRGETLAAISRAYDVPADVLAVLNRLRPRGHLRAGRVLVVPLSSAARRAAEAIARRRGGAKRRVRVRAGDTLWSIARRHGVTVKELARWNGISDPGRHRLRVGHLLNVNGRHRASAARAAKALPGRRARHAGEATPRRVRVRSGDSLWSIARRHGVTVKELARWNGIRRSRQHRLRAGRLLVVRRAGGR
jgi:membrane-bound lytic murein transglycosylase D